MRQIFALLLLALPVATLAAVPPALLPLQKQGYTIGQSFIAPDGLTGWVVTFSGRSFIVYTTQSGNYGFSASLVDKDGNDLTAQYRQRYLQDADLAIVAASLAQDPTLVDEGSPTAPPLYVFADANCIYCNHLWNQLRPYVATGKVRVHWVIVTFLKASSLGRGAAILTASDKLSALTLDETRFDTIHEEGGIPPLDTVPDTIRAAVVGHADALHELGGEGTPFLLYRNAGKWVSVEGMPKDLQGFVVALDRAP